MKESTQKSIKERLKEIHDQFEQLINDIRENPFDRLWIKTKYGSLKTRLKTEMDIYHTLKGKNEATDDEKSLYYPAVSEAFCELTARVDAPPNQKMLDCLFSGQGQIDYYLSQIDN